MKICYIALGKFTHIGAYLEYFKNAGHDVHFLSLSPAFDYGVPTYNVGFGTKYSATKGKWKYPFSMIRARKLIHKLKPDIVHAHYVTSCGLTALVSGFKPYVLTVHGSDLALGIQSCFWRPLLKLIFKRAACINTVSDELTKMAISLGTDSAKVKTLTLGIDTSRFEFVLREPLQANKQIRMVCTRRLEEIFDHATILNSIAILRDKDVDCQLTLIGDGTIRNKLEQQVKSLGLGKIVTFNGAVANEELPIMLNDFDVYLSASVRDGTSLCLLEVMAAGLFPIVSDINANSVWIRHCQNGLLHKVGDAKDLANKILFLRFQQTLFSQAVKENREKVVSFGDRLTNMRHLEQLYNMIVTIQKQ